ncbi:GNAT family N-acetyltransferase [Sphingomonas hengshuiensis]|uniref:GNAT family acetyltransferase n=1 Tax=Sphingomonas hengshuiensis TaxID=1609977 RepID=A0A7U4JB25_9SPHN|nr:GNAT family N-acetyltransferase [Sphingomonas hengshuiensis]AJP73541.1 GNAT family acetyltransferase [Sphingomonas hengshuiensis]
MTYRLSFERAEQQLDLIHAFLSGAYWSVGIPRDVVERAIAGSFCAGMFDGEGEQVGFARLITDRATFAYLADVFVLPAHRGQGLARRMIEGLQGHPELQGLRRWLLFTRDMQPLYAKLGWTPIPHPERCMERHFVDLYTA